MKTNQLLGGIVHHGEGNNFNLLGHSITTVFSKQKTDGEYYVFQVVTPRGLGLPKHVHELEDELIYMIEGAFEIELGDRTFTAKAGDSVFFPRGIAHAFKNASSTPTTAIFTVSPGASFELFFNKLAAMPPEPPEMDEVVKIFGEHGMTILP